LKNYRQYTGILKSDISAGYYSHSNEELYSDAVLALPLALSAVIMGR
jgi:hypothetical protein